MYAFYNRAKICYVYLYDVESLTDFGQSSWFTRGWTLQELLAPTKLHFFNHKWEPIGSRRRLASSIETITGIPTQALQNFSPAEYCVAEKFSWSAKRETTREEDCAYCLLGLFQINMPLLYGEGARAFQRLQEEIMKISTDMSIFLWQGSGVDAFGMLASNPSCFSGIPENFTNMGKDCIDHFSKFEGWSLNNAGISMEAILNPYLLAPGFGGIYTLHLNGRDTFPDKSSFAIFVQVYDKGQEIPSFARVTIDGIAWTSSLTGPEVHLPFHSGTRKLRLLRQPLADICTAAGPCGYDVFFKSDNLGSCAAYQRPFGNPHPPYRSWQQLELCSGTSSWSFSANRREATGLHGFFLFTLVGDIQIMICLGLDRNFQPLYIVLPFCKQMLDNGLGSWYLHAKYHLISQNQKDDFTIFDPETHMWCSSYEIRFGSFERDTDMGVSLTYLCASNLDGKVEVGIVFDIEKFIRYYIPTANLSRYISIDHMSREYTSIAPLSPEIYGQLLDIDFRINSKPRGKLR